MKSKTCLGPKIKEKRTRKGLTQKQLAAKLGYSYQLICDWENGRKEPTLGSIIKLMKEIKLTKRDLIQSTKKEDELCKN